MSLVTAILDVASNLESDAKRLDDFAGNMDDDAIRLNDIAQVMLAGNIRAIRAAVKACEGESVSVRLPDEKEIARKKQARDESQLIEQAMQRESSGFNTAELIGGGLDGDMIPVDPKMPVGARTAVAGKVFRLEDDRKLHYEKDVATTGNYTEKGV